MACLTVSIAVLSLLSACKQHYQYTTTYVRSNHLPKNWPPDSCTRIYNYCKPVREYTMFCKLIRCNIMLPDQLFHKPTRLALVWPHFSLCLRFCLCTEEVLLLYWTHSVCQMCIQDCCSTHFAFSSTKMYHSFLNIGKMWVARGWVEG